MVVLVALYLFTGLGSMDLINPFNGRLLAAYKTNLSIIWKWTYGYYLNEHQKEKKKSTFVTLTNLDSGFDVQNGGSKNIPSCIALKNNYNIFRIHYATI